MSNRIATINAITDRDTQLGITIFTSDYGFEIHVAQNSIRIFEGNIILGTGIKKLTSINVNETFDHSISEHVSAINAHEQKLSNLPLSIRLINALHTHENVMGMNFKDMKLKDISRISIDKFKRSRGVGKTTLTELKLLAESSGIHLSK